MRSEEEKSKKDPSRIIKIYPNPVKDNLTMDLPENTTLNSAEVFSMQGKEVLKVINPSSNIELKTLEPGLYLLRVNLGNNNISVQKFIKE